MLTFQIKELINPAHLRHILISPRRRAQRTAELVSSFLVLGFNSDLLQHGPLPENPSL